MKNNTAAFTPVTITAETLQILSRQKNYSNLLTLYMACVEITTWQGGNNIKASASFMMKRLSWGEDKLIKTKADLVKLGLLEPFTRRDKEGKVEGHYTLVKHVISQNPLKPRPGFDHALVSEGTNTNDYKQNTNDSKSNFDFGEEIKTNSPPAIQPNHTAVLTALIQIVNPNEKVTADRLTKLNARLKDYTIDEIVDSAKAFSKSEWHKENKQMSIDNLLAPSKFGRWFAVRTTPEESTPEYSDEQKEADKIEAARRLKEFQDGVK